MESITIPTSIREAFSILDNMLSAEEKAAALSRSRQAFCDEEFFSLGCWIRNNWIYGPDEESSEEAALRDQCFRILAGMKAEEMVFDHPDDVSIRFLGRYYDHLKRTRR